MIPLIQLNVEHTDLHDAAQRAKIADWVAHYAPQTNTGKPPWDPSDPNNPANEQRKESWGRIIQVSEVNLTTGLDYFKAQMILSGLDLLRADLYAAGLLDEFQSLAHVEGHMYVWHFDHPTNGYQEPDGWDWDWVACVPMLDTWNALVAWFGAGWQFNRTNTVSEAVKKLKNQGWPTGWVRLKPGNMVEQFQVMPNLCIPECRAWLIGRQAQVMAWAGMTRTALTLKSGLLHGNSPIHSTPAQPRSASPWLPSPYPGDTYRDANNDLTLEMAAAFGGENVSATNTGFSADPSAVPPYTYTRHGGLDEMPAGNVLHGYWITNMLLSHRWFTEHK